MSALQSNIVIGDDTITGNLAHVTGFTGFSSNVDEQSGNYLVLKMATVPSDNVDITVEVVGGTVGHPVTLDADRNIVLRITDKTTETIRVIARNAVSVITKTYGLTGLTLATAG